MSNKTKQQLLELKHEAKAKVPKTKIPLCCSLLTTHVKIPNFIVLKTC